MGTLASLFGALARVGALLLVGAPAHAASCEQLRASVEAKIHSKGVKNFSVEIADAHASVAGQVVGSCDLGSKKLVYTKSGAGASAPGRPVAPASPVPAPKAGVITECADGRVLTQGSCKR